MAVTGAVAWPFGADLLRLSMGEATRFFPAATLEFLFASGFRWAVIFAPLVMVFALSAGINRMSAATAQMALWGFSALMGLSLSTVFVVYTGASIAQMFFVTAIAFASLSLWGYTTKTDISGWGSFLFMGVVGIIVASIVNLFLGSPALDFAVSVIGVLVFAGLTAYDTQAIKQRYIDLARHADADTLGRSAVIGALGLYLNFINMLMFLLSLFGKRE